MIRDMASNDPADESRVRKASGIARKHAAEARSLIDKLTKFGGGEPTHDDADDTPQPDNRPPPHHSERLKGAARRR